MILIKKIVLILTCITLAACSSASFSAEENEDYISFKEDSTVLGEYTFHLSDTDAYNRVDIIYAEEKDNHLQEVKRSSYPLKDGTVIQVTAAENTIQLTVKSGDVDETVQLTAAKYSEEIAYRLIDKKTIINGKDILVYLSAEKITSIQSEIVEDWTTFEGDCARAVIFSFQ